MSNNNFDEIISRSLEIRKKYHELERRHHGSEWTMEEDALAFLTDAGLVGKGYYVSAATLAQSEFTG